MAKKKSPPRASAFEQRERLLMKAINDRLRKQRVQGGAKVFQLLTPFMGTVVKKDGRFDQMGFIGGENFKLAAIVESSGDLVFRPTDASNFNEWHVTDDGAIALLPEFEAYWNQLRAEEATEIDNVIHEDQDKQRDEILEEARKINPEYGAWE